MNKLYQKAYTKGDFILHSGKKSKYLFDVMKLIGEPEFIAEYHKFIRYRNRRSFVVGIEFGGAVLASLDAGYGRKFAIVRKDGTIYGSTIPDDYVLLDDVVSTENSLKTAIWAIGKEPKKIKCIVDRRKEKILKIESMLEYLED